MIAARRTLLAIAMGLAGPLAVLTAAVASETAVAAPLYDGGDGATCGYFNVGGLIPWQRRGGDWVDRNGAMHGTDAYVRQPVAAENRVRTISIDVTDLAQRAAQRQRHLELMLREVSDRAGGTIHFFSREAEADQGPRLVLELSDGRTVRVAASADARISCSTYRSLGTGNWLSIADNFNTVVAFDLRTIPASQIKRASLSLTTREKQYGAVTLGVFELANPMKRGKLLEVPRAAGLASRYPNDAGIAKDPAVIFFEDFEPADWRGRWSEVSGDLEAVSDDGEAGFAPHAGRALKVRIGEGRSYGGSVRFKFRDRTGSEPEQAYFRYMLRFGDDWLPIPQGGKLPGFASTYGRAAWGGRKADGSNGWSARGSFNPATKPGNPLHGLTTIGSYTYHADMQTRFGDIWPWTERSPTLLANNRWYSVENHVKLNTPGKNNGVLRAWVDGELVFERTDVRFRNISELRIEELWMNIYFGGTRPSARTMHLFIDNVVIADRYIGPVAAGTATNKLKQ